MQPRISKSITCVIARLNVGGAAMQAILMTNAFRARGYRTLLLCGEIADGERSMEYLARSKQVPIVRVRRMARPISLLRDLSAAVHILRILLREKPCIVHTHTAKAGVLGRLAATIACVPVRVHTFHGHVFDGYFSPIMTRIFIAIERMLARYTDCIVAVSERQHWELVHRFRIAAEEKVVTVPLGFEVEQFLGNNPDEGSLRGQLQCPTGRLLVGWVGRLTEIKNPGLFVRVAAALRTNSVSAQFVMVGDGILSFATRQDVLTYGLDDVFCFLATRADMPKVYSALDLLVLTSRNEGTPVVLLEAMASGKPFVATRVGGIPDLMVGAPRQMNGYQVFANGILSDATPDALAAAVKYLLDRPDLCREMGTEGRRFVETRYSHERLADDLERLYGKLIVAKLQAGNRDEVRHLKRNHGTDAS